jgi:hypothetical protein
VVSRLLAWLLDETSIWDAVALEKLEAANSQRSGLGTFIPPPNELGPGQTTDLTAEGDWDLVCASIPVLAGRFADA